MKKEHGLTHWQAKRYRDEIGKCEICGSTERLTVDHCHTTGAIRGVLCNYHNMLVGIVEKREDDIDLARDYLANHLDSDPLFAEDFETYNRSGRKKPLPPHGTVARYTGDNRCRCDECRKAIREWSRNHKGYVPRPDDWGSPDHGTYAMYQQERKQGLPACDECKEANRKYHNELYRKRRAKKLAEKASRRE